MKSVFGNIKEKLFPKLHPNDEAILNGLNDDTQVILKNFMEKADHYGKEVYLVRDVVLFDTLIKNHTFKKFNYYGGCDLDYCINENLKSGKGFILFVNGEQYVAIPPPKYVDADSLINRIE